MSNIIKLPTFENQSGKLTVLEKKLPFEVKRTFWIYQVKENRGSHKHKITHQALIAVSGSVRIKVENSGKVEEYLLSSPDSVLLLEPNDWHEMINFSNDCILLVLASSHYDPEDYIYEKN